MRINNIKFHPKLNNLNIIEFNVEGVHFPNVENAHVSEQHTTDSIENLLPESIDQIYIWTVMSFVFLNLSMKQISNLNYLMKVKTQSV